MADITNSQNVELSEFYCTYGRSKAPTVRAMYITFDRYLNISRRTNERKGKELLIRSFFPWLTKNDIDSDSWFMQDGATPHRTKDVFETLYKRFEYKFIGLG